MKVDVVVVVSSVETCSENLGVAFSFTSTIAAYRVVGKFPSSFGACLR